MRLVECVALMLIKEQQVLAEKRKLTKRVVPGAVALPGGHLEADEPPEAGLCREAHEEFGIILGERAYVCTLLHRAQEFRKLHYFAVTSWKGEIQSYEADAVLWIPLPAWQRFDLDVDRVAMQEYMRVYHGELLRPRDGLS